ncbi:MAG: metallophosphoesterase [Bacteroidales bacterium]|nr:metallophosphoesterase [Bacteroidales bacterium]
MDRRHFLESVAVLGAAAATVPAALAGCAPGAGKGWRGKFDENLVCIISDLHTIPDGFTEEKLKRVLTDILALNPRPRHLISLGDNAHLYGKPAEYARLKEILAPLEGSGIRFTMAHGNHDKRANFAPYFPEQVASSALPDRLVHVVETPRADLIVLDSLQDPDNPDTYIGGGAIDEFQRAWLESRLASYTDKPVFVMAHHGIGETGLNGLLNASATCCGYIHGHDHVWRPGWNKKNWSERRILRTLCVPSTGYWGDIGYTLLRLEEDRAVACLTQYEFFFLTPAEADEKPLPQWASITGDHQGATCTFNYLK